MLSQRARRRLVVAAALGVGGYAAYCTWRDNARLRKAVRSTAAELQRCGEAALTRATACVVAGTVQGVAMVRPQVRNVFSLVMVEHSSCECRVMFVCQRVWMAHSSVAVFTSPVSRTTKAPVLLAL